MPASHPSTDGARRAGVGLRGEPSPAEPSAPRRQRALPQPWPRSLTAPAARRAPHPPTRPQCLTAPPGAVDGGGGRRRHLLLLLLTPAAGIYLAGEPALPGPAPTSTALPAAAGDKGEGPLSGSLAPHPSSWPGGRAAANTTPTPSESGAGGRHLSSSSKTALSAQSPSSPGPSRDAVS